MNNIFKNILNDVKTELNSEFDRNFERKSFFGQSWPATKHHYSRGSLLLRSGILRRSITSRISDESITWTSSVPYASIHNDGGEIIVTTKMIKFFWAMHFKAAGAVNKSAGGTARNIRLNDEAQKWKNMALMKVGTVIKIDKRQFIGSHPQIKVIVTGVLNENMKELDQYLRNKLKR